MIKLLFNISRRRPVFSVRAYTSIQEQRPRPDEYGAQEMDYNQGLHKHKQVNTNLEDAEQINSNLTEKVISKWIEFVLYMIFSK